MKHERKTNLDVPIHTKSYRFSEIYKEEVKKNEYNARTEYN